MKNCTISLLALLSVVLTFSSATAQQEPGKNITAVPAMAEGLRHGFLIEQMNTEQPGPGQTDTNNARQAFVSDINDPKNSGIGDLNYWVVEGNVGAVEKFTKNGGASIRTRWTGSAPDGSRK